MSARIAAGLVLSAALLLAAGAGALGAASTPRAGLGTLTADQLAGQRIVCAFAGRTVPTDLARRVSR
ncbi:MAG: hypothetical protein ACXWEA_02625, partial [Solirubrobacterales bacterium]